MLGNIQSETSTDTVGNYPKGKEKEKKGRKRQSSEMMELIERQNKDFQERMEQHHRDKMRRMDRFLDLYEKDVKND